MKWGRPLVQARFRWLVLGTASFVLLGLMVGLARRGEVVASPSPTMLKSPQLSTLFLGDGTLTITEEVSDVPPSGVGSLTGLGAFTMGFFYPANLIGVTVEEGPFLSSTGRSTFCTTNRIEGFIEFYCISSGPGPGPTGSGVLAYIRVTPRAGLILKPTLGNGALAILDDQAWAAGLADVLGDSIQVSRVGDAAVVVQALEGDLNLDCVVNIIDEQAIAYRYDAREGSLFYAPFYDLEPPIGDGDIDVKDVQFVFGRLGRVCQPTPTPTPSATPTTTVTPSPAGAPTNTATASPTATIPTATGTPPTATVTTTPTPAATGVGTPTGTPTPTPGGTTTPGPTGTSTPIPSGTPTPTPSGSLTPTPTAVTTPTPGGSPAIAAPTGTVLPGSALGATTTPLAMATAVLGAPTGTPGAAVLPAVTQPARFLPPAGNGPADGWPAQAAIAAGVLATVGLALLVLSLRRRASDRAD